MLGFAFVRWQNKRAKGLQFKVNFVNLKPNSNSPCHDSVRRFPIWTATISRLVVAAQKEIYKSNFIRLKSNDSDPSLYTWTVRFEGISSTWSTFKLEEKC